MMVSIKNYAAVTSAYWGFTLTDGALRMLVLLHFHNMGYSPIDLAILFLLYEAMGIITNFFGGIIGARFGLKNTLFSGLAIQIIALIMLAYMPNSLTITSSVLYVMLSQSLSGIAKDLTKMSSKSAVKLIIPENQNGKLFKWISILTGSKNTLKGIGFFLGGFLLQLLDFKWTLLSMGIGLTTILTVLYFTLNFDLGKSAKEITTKELFSKNDEINFLCLARLFLFCSRDIWFVVSLPVFLNSVAGFDFEEVGSFMALWVIGYGVIQSFVPKLIGTKKQLNNILYSSQFWCFTLAFIPLLLGCGITPFGLEICKSIYAEFDITFWIISGLVVFGVIFAINSALHSYLIVAFSEVENVSVTVGFYYMANAAGRLLGTLLSGLVYQYYGFSACLILSGLMILISGIFMLLIPQKQRTIA